MKPSSFIEFERKIRGKNFPRITLHRMFKREVEKADYAGSSVEQLLAFLQRVNCSQKTAQQSHA